MIKRLLPCVAILFMPSSFSIQAALTSDSPERSTVHCSTSKGPLLIQVNHKWAPLGAQRFMELVRDNFYRDIALFRCVDNFLVQFGISDKPEKKHWHNSQIKDDPNLHLGIKKNYISFAGGGADTRSTQIFIAFKDLDFLGKEPWETPFAQVIKGEDTLNKLYKGYGDMPPFGTGPNQSKLQNKGNAYIHNEFPLIDFIYDCTEVGSHREIPPDIAERMKASKDIFEKGVFPPDLHEKMKARRDNLPDEFHKERMEMHRLDHHRDIEDFMREKHDPKELREFMMKRQQEILRQDREEGQHVEEGEEQAEVDPEGEAAEEEGEEEEEEGANEIPKVEEDDEEEEEKVDISGKTHTHKKIRLKGTVNTILPLYYCMVLVVGGVVVYVYRKYIFKPTPVNKKV